MQILNLTEANDIRAKYIQSFVNTNSAHYIDYIKTVKMYKDGLCYEGYLWDCLKNPTVVTEEDIIAFLRTKTNMYIMWDIHSAEKIFIPSYWKYPKSSVLLVESWSNDVLDTLPEDIYFFDKSFSWSAVLTHEDIDDGKRYCLIVGSAESYLIR